MCFLHYQLYKNEKRIDDYKYSLELKRTWKVQERSQSMRAQERQRVQRGESNYKDGSLRVMKIEERVEERTEQNQSLWEPVKLEGLVNTFPKIKEQQPWVTPPSKNILNRKVDWNNAIEVQSYMKKYSRQYHKYLIDELLKQEKVKVESVVKQEEREWVVLDKNLSIFPLDNQLFKTKVFKSIEEVKQQLIKQEQDILSQIGDGECKSVFIDNLQESVKQSESKRFYNIKCQIEGCSAMIKCSCEPQKGKCDIYLLRNKHSHTITGQILERKKDKPPITIVIDDQLHERFGFKKGVRSQTRNQKYLNPEERKNLKAEQSRQYRLRKKQLKNDSIVKLEFQGVEKQQNKKGKLKSKKIKKKAHKVVQVFNNSKKIQQFQSLCLELRNKNYIVESEQNIQDPSFIFIAKTQYIQKIYSPTIRIMLRKSTFKMKSKRQQFNSQWSFLLITALNKCLKPYILAFCISLDTFDEMMTKVFASIQKHFPPLKIIISEYTPELFQYFKNFTSKIGQQYQILFDQGDIAQELMKHCCNDSSMKTVRKLLTPLYYFQRQKLLEKLQKHNEKDVLQKFKLLKQYVIIPQTLSEQFFGVTVDLRGQKMLIQKFKQRLQVVQQQQSLKCLLQITIDEIQTTSTMNIFNKTEYSCLQIEKVHCDINLKQVRKSVSPQILNHFYLQYGKAKEKRKFNRSIWVDNQECSCKFTKLIGIPCRHLIGERIKRGLPYLDLFHSKWKISQLNNEQNIKLQRQQFRTKSKRQTSLSKGLSSRRSIDQKK